MTKMLLHLENVSKVYKSGTVGLDEVSLSVYPGEFIAIIGPSGAGKSTFLRCVNMLHHPTGGSIYYEGRDISKMKERRLRRVRGSMGMIFQNYNLVTRVSVIENVLHGCLGRMSVAEGILGKYRQEDKEKALSLLEEMGLSEKANCRADELSGGQQQRVGICRALAQEPGLILADEPIASLDPKSSEIVMDSLRESCRKRGISCIVNLHQVDIARKYATRIIGMRKGKIIFDDKPEKLTESMLEYIYHVEDETKKPDGVMTLEPVG